MSAPEINALECAIGELKGGLCCLLVIGEGMAGTETGEALIFLAGKMQNSRRAAQKYVEDIYAAKRPGAVT